MDHFQCSLASILVHDDWYLVGQVWQILVGLVTILLYFLSRKDIVRMLMNREAALLMNYLLLSVCLHSAIFISTQIHHLVRDFYLAKTDCDLLLDNLVCMVVKICTQCFTINISTLFLCFCVERTLVTFPSTKNTARSKMFCRLATVLVTVISVFLAILVYYPDLQEEEKSASCFFHTRASGPHVDLMYYGLIVSNTLALLWMMALFLLNKKAENRTSDPLHIRYQIKENLTISKIFLVAGSVQTLLIVFHSVANMIRRNSSIDIILYRILALDSYMISYANLSYVILLCIMLKLRELSRKKTIQSDVSHYRKFAANSYFNQYNW